MSPVQTALNVGRRMRELEQDIARAKRTCAAHGWTEADLEAIRAGADFRDLLRGDARGTWLRGER